MDEYICAFIDVLGAGERGNDEEFAKGIDKVFEFIQASSKQRYGWLTRFFGDGLMIARKVENNFILVANDLFTFLARLSEKALFDAECLLRGGVAHGKLHIGKYSVFGQALVDAHKIESKEAIYPRIVIHDDIVRKLTDPKAKSREARELPLLRDFDGRIYIWSLMMCIVDPDTAGESTISELIEIFSKMIRRTSDPYVLQKYAWWANVVNNALESNRRNERISM